MNCQRRIGVAVFAVVIVCIAVGGWQVSAATNQLELGFESPPADCRPQVLWDWMGGMVSRDGITKDLEALKAQGIGGVLIMQMPDQPPYPRQWSFRDYPGKLKCLSDEYFATMNFGIAEADRLGLEFGVYACPGWSHLGGPWVKPDDGLKKLACSRIYVTGPTNLSVQLERAPITIGYRGGNEMPEWSRDVKLLNVRYGNFHQDEGVIALPWREPGNPISPGQITNLTSRMDAAGNFTWAVPPGSWTIWRLAVVSDNSVNHPAPVESIGLECDRMDAAALTPVLDNYVGRIAREAKAKGLHSFKRFESDSYEGGHQDYGRDFSAQFQKRRGYNCLPWLPAWLEPGVIIGDTNLTVRFRADMTATITELWAERFHAPLQKTADALGLEWMLEPYGMFELNWRDTAAQCAHPGWEFWVGQGWHAERVADTAALYGRRVVWAESFTAEPYRSAWRLDPWTLKRDGDRAWCGGVNSFFMHGFVHQPFGDEFQPGLTMGYWGTQLGRHVTWWNFSRPWHEYLARGQFLLRQGDPQNDVLLYPQPASDEAIRPLGGYRGVTLSDDILIHKLRVENGLLTLPHGAKFAALALNPGLPLRPEALAKIHRLVQDGAILIGDAPPPRSPSLENFPQCDAAVKNWISKLWGGQTNSPGRKLGQGIIFPAAEFFSTLENTIGPPDFAATDLADATKSPPVLSFCRRAGETIFWVVSNQSDDEQAVLAQFRVTGLQPEWWDPVDGSRRELAEFRRAVGRTEVPLRLAPRQTGFVVFQKKSGANTAGPMRLEKNFPATAPGQELSGPWNVAFDPRWGGPEKVSFDRLQNWSGRPEAGIRYYSGTAVYLKTFDAGDDDARGGRTFLDLGVVKNLARVRLNGRDLGIVWCAPWRVEIPDGVLLSKNNRLEIEVVNTWVNRMIGDEQEPEDCPLEPGNADGDRKGGYAVEIRGRGLKDLPDWFVNGQPRPSAGRFTFTSWRYYDKDAPLQPSGLLGPVRLMVSTK